MDNTLVGKHIKLTRTIRDANGVVHRFNDKGVILKPTDTLGKPSYYVKFEDGTQGMVFTYEADLVEESEG